MANKLPSTRIKKLSILQEWIDRFPSAYISIYAKKTAFRAMDIGSWENCLLEMDAEFEEIELREKDYPLSVQENPDDPNTWLIIDSLWISKQVFNDDVRIWRVLEDVPREEAKDYTLRPLVLNGVVINPQKLSTILRKLRTLEIYAINFNNDVELLQRLKHHPDDTRTDESAWLEGLLHRAFRCHIVTSLWHFVDEGKNAHSLVRILFDIMNLWCFDENEVVQDICKLKVIANELKLLRDKSVAHLDTDQVKDEVKVDGYATTHTIQHVREPVEKMAKINGIMSKWIGNLTATNQSLTSYTFAPNKKVYYSLTYGD